MNMSSSLLSQKVQTLTLSPTLALTAAAKKLQSEGIDIISLAAGEPDILPPLEIIQQLQQAALKPEACAYTATAGLPQLRNAISLWLQEHRDLTYSSDKIMITPGCKMAIFQALFSVLNAGDEVVFGTPHWVSYPQMTLACGGVPIAVPTSEKSNFLISTTNLSKYISSRSKAIILNSPHNPTGQYHSHSELEALAAVLIQYPQITIISDDIYDSLMPHRPTHILHVAPELAGRTVVINGLSKSFGVTGWRLGFAAGPQYLIDAMTKFQSQTTTCVATPIQYAAISAYEYDDQEAFFMKSAQTYRSRATDFLQALSPLKSLRCLPMHASFYIWADISELMKEHGFQTDDAFSQDLLATARVAAVPGSAFGMQGYLRLSLTAPVEKLCEAARRIVQRYLKY